MINTAHAKGGIVDIKSFIFSKDITFPKDKVAFTLAEVLITLAIIGVVAAITIPTLIAKIQEKRYTTQYKKIFSELNQSMKMLEDDESSPITMCKSFEDNCFRDLFAGKMKVSQVCNGGVPNKCQALSFFLNKKTSYYKMNINDSWPALVTLSGYSVKFRFHRADCNFAPDAETSWAGILRNCGWVQVDTNGLSAPNEVGKDIFFLALMQDRFIPYYESDDKITDCYNGTGISCASVRINSGGMHFSKK